MASIRTDTKNMTTARIQREFERIEEVTNALAVELNNRGVMAPLHAREISDAERCRELAMTLRREHRRLRHKLGRNAPPAAHSGFMTCAEAAEHFEQAADALEAREQEVAA